MMKNEIEASEMLSYALGLGIQSRKYEVFERTNELKYLNMCLSV